ncbi:hypothetical protein CWI36_3287p0010, partial [Hamiltosporidium magnivora]
SNEQQGVNISSNKQQGVNICTNKQHPFTNNIQINYLLDLYLTIKMYLPLEYKFLLTNILYGEGCYYKGYIRGWWGLEGMEKGVITKDMLEGVSLLEGMDKGVITKDMLEGVSVSDTGSVEGVISFYTHIVI